MILCLRVKLPVINFWKSKKKAAERMTSKIKG